MTRTTAMIHKMKPMTSSVPTASLSHTRVITSVERTLAWRDGRAECANIAGVAGGGGRPQDENPRAKEPAAYIPHKQACKRATLLNARRLLGGDGPGDSVPGAGAGVLEAGIFW